MTNDKVIELTKKLKEIRKNMAELEGEYLVIEEKIWKEKDLHLQRNILNKEILEDEELWKNKKKNKKKH